MVQEVIDGIYILREKVFSVNDTAPEDNIKSNSKFYNLSAKDINGKTINFSDYKGKKVLIVNVASKCGYTSQYKDLQELYNKYNDKITILAFPSNNFGFQEPGSNNQIEEFCETNYGIKFQLFEKSDVRGKNSNQVNIGIETGKRGNINKLSIKENYLKFIVGSSINNVWFIKRKFD